MSTGGLRELKKQRTRFAIQREATRLISEQGYDATTVEQIAAAAEVSPATFFRYFKTKEDVVLADDYDPILVAALQGAPAELGPVAALRHALRESIGQLPLEERQQVLVRVRLIMSIPALRARALDNMLATIDVLAEAFGARLGRPATDLQVRTLLGAIIGSWTAILLEWVAAEGERDLADMMDEALVILQTGLAR